MQLWIPAGHGSVADVVTKVDALIAKVSGIEYGGNIVRAEDGAAADGAAHRVHQLRDGRTSFETFRLIPLSSHDHGAIIKIDQFTGRERHVRAACWHAHRDIMVALFEAFPTARLKTREADYNGKERFEELFPRTGRRNIRSQMAPMQYQESCDC